MNQSEILNQSGNSEDYKHKQLRKSLIEGNKITSNKSSFNNSISKN